MRAIPHMTGMQGVYLVAVELTRRGFVVSPTSRSAFGADLLVTDQKCKKAWSIQVKANFGRPGFWLVNKHSKQTKSGSHIYVLVNLGQRNPRQKLKGIDYYVVPSRVLARKMTKTPPRGRTRTVFYSIFRNKVQRYKDKWSVFGPGITP